MPDKVYDLIIVGCGPAGLSAAINAAIRKKQLLVIGGEFCSLKLHSSPIVENYLGFPKIKGEELRQKFLEHASQAGIEIMNHRVVNIFPMEKDFIVNTSKGEFHSRSIILALGLTPARYYPGEKEYLGKGVSYCTTCDGALFAGKKVGVISETGEGEDEANFLADICDEVLYFPLYEEQLHLKPNVKVRRDKPVKIKGQDFMTHLETEEAEEALDGLFIIKKVVSVDQLIPDLEIRENTVVVDRQMATNIKGVFAAGDCTGRPFQLAKAVGEGQIAGLSAVSYLDRLEKGEWRGN